MLPDRRSLFALLILCAGCASDAGARRPGPGARDGLTAEREVPRANDKVRAGEEKLQQNDVDGARALFVEAIADDPNDARAHLDLGIVLELQNDPEAAIAAYRAAIAAQADLAEALNNLGVLLRDRGELPEAIALLQRATSANPQSAAAHMNLALAFEDSNQVEAAVAQYEEALRLQPDELMTRVNLGLLLVDMGKLDSGRAQLEQARSSAQGNRAALLAIGNGLRRAGDGAGALGALQDAVDTPEAVTPALLAELGLAQRAAGDRDAAIATLEKALKIDARYATGHYLLGNLLAGGERFKEAREHYQKYLALEPEGPQAAQARERLARIIHEGAR